MNPKVKELRQKRAAIVQEMHDLTEQTTFTDEAQQRWALLDTQQKALEVQIRALESQSTLDAEMRTVTVPPQVQPGATIEDPAARAAETMDTAQKRTLEIISSPEYR